MSPSCSCHRLDASNCIRGVPTQLAKALEIEGDHSQLLSSKSGSKWPCKHQRLLTRYVFEISGVNLLSFYSSFTNYQQILLPINLWENFSLMCSAWRPEMTLTASLGHEGLPFSDFWVIDLFLQCWFIMAVVQLFGLLLKIRKAWKTSTLSLSNQSSFKVFDLLHWQDFLMRFCSLFGGTGSRVDRQNPKGAYHERHQQFLQSIVEQLLSLLQQSHQWPFAGGLKKCTRSIFSQNSVFLTGPYEWCFLGWCCGRRAWRCWNCFSRRFGWHCLWGVTSISFAGASTSIVFSKGGGWITSWGSWLGWPCCFITLFSFPLTSKKRWLSNNWEYQNECFQLECGDMKTRSQINELITFESSTFDHIFDSQKVRIRCLKKGSFFCGGIPNLFRGTTKNLFTMC